MPSAMHFDKRLTTLERSSYSDDAIVVVLLKPGDDNAETAKKIAAAKGAKGLAEDDACQVIVVPFGVA